MQDVSSTENIVLVERHDIKIDLKIYKDQEEIKAYYCFGDLRVELCTMW